MMGPALMQMVGGKSPWKQPKKGKMWRAANKLRTKARKVTAATNRIVNQGKYMSNSAANAAAKADAAAAAAKNAAAKADKACTCTYGKCVLGPSPTCATGMAECMYGAMLNGCGYGPGLKVKMPTEMPKAPPAYQAY